MSDQESDRLERLERAGFSFLMTDLELGLTLTRVASSAREASEKRNRNRTNARRAYDAVWRISRHAFLNSDERQEVTEKLSELKAALEQLGEVFA